MNPEEALSRKQMLDELYLEELGQDIFALHHQREYFEHVMKLVSNNERLEGRRNTFIRWLRWQYNTTRVILLRRLIDNPNRNKSISFVTLLKKISDDPDFLSELGLNKEEVENDRDEIIKRLEPIGDYVDKWVAHKDEDRERIPIPTMQEVDDVYETTFKLLSKYFGYFRDADLIDPTPVTEERGKKCLVTLGIPSSNAISKNRIKGSPIEKRSKTILLLSRSAQQKRHPRNGAPSIRPPKVAATKVKRPFCSFSALV